MIPIHRTPDFSGKPLLSSGQHPGRHDDTQLRSMVDPALDGPRSPTVCLNGLPPGVPMPRTTSILVKGKGPGRPCPCRCLDLSSVLDLPLSIQDSLGRPLSPSRCPGDQALEFPCHGIGRETVAPKLLQGRSQGSGEVSGSVLSSLARSVVNLASEAPGGCPGVSRYQGQDGPGAEGLARLVQLR